MAKKPAPAPVIDLGKPGSTSADTVHIAPGLHVPGIHDIANAINRNVPGSQAIDNAGHAIDRAIGRVVGGKKKSKKVATPVTTPVAASAPPSAASAFGLDPLSTQLFYAGTIAPLLQQNNQRMMDYAGAMQKSLGQAPASGLPKNFASLFANTGKDLGNEYGFLSNALANATASAPAIDSIMNYVNLDRSQQIKTYDIIQKMISDQAGTSGLPANIAQLLGVAPTTVPATPIQTSS